jgi:hypothetical protein
MMPFRADYFATVIARAAFYAFEITPRFRFSLTLP